MYQKTCIALHQALYCIKRDSEVYKYICSCNPVKYYHFQVKKKGISHAEATFMSLRDATVQTPHTGVHKKYVIPYQA
jgi:hypothetical protein